MSNVEVVFDDGVWYQFLTAEGEGGKYVIKKALQVVNQAKRNCPVDTGRLRNSIRYEVSGGGEGFTVRVGSDVEYAGYVELGTRYMAPRSYLRNALFSVLGTA